MPTWQERQAGVHNHQHLPFQKGDREELFFLALALAGEAGELANVVKKLWRGDTNYPPEHFHQELRMELADVRIYLHLICQHLGVDLDALCAEKVDILEQRESARFYQTAPSSPKG